MATTVTAHGNRSMAQENGSPTPASPMVKSIGEVSSLTPPRGRSSSRYPVSLARGEPGRVPLHRRGTSRTYERLEDLLREAGYKETRIFTPDAERREEEGRRSSVKGSVDAVVGYIASWMPNAGRSGDPTESKQSSPSGVREERLHRSTPPSPLVHKRKSERTAHTRSPLSVSPTASSTTTASLRSRISSDSGSPAVRYQRSVQQLYVPQRHLRPQASASGTLRTYAQVSAAQGYLRHIASNPNMAMRSSSSRGTATGSASVVANSTSALPALPSRWLDQVTKAVAGSGHPDAHVGGPSASRRVSLPSSRTSRAKKESKPTLADRPSKSPGGSVSGAPPGLTSYLIPPEAATSAVSTAQVMCRSAPASRSSSRVGDRPSYGSLRTQASGRGRTARRPSKCDGVPSLATTSIENDVWSTQWVHGLRVPILFVKDNLAQSSMDEYDDDDDDDEGELDFARLLVPPKRQYSIQSLRRHLHHSHSNLRDQALTREVEDDFGTRGRGRSDSMDDEGHEWDIMGAPGFNAKKRSRIPGSWARS